jgi:hypothetical protein
MADLKISCESYICLVLPGMVYLNNLVKTFVEELAIGRAEGNGSLQSDK